MVLAIHGVAGGWDELAIAVVAFAVLWVAVKLAGRKPADADDDEDDDNALEREPSHDPSTVDADRLHKDPAPPATPLA